MIDFCGTIYYIDMNALCISISPPIAEKNKKITETVISTIKDAKGKVLQSETVETINDRHGEINGAKYDVIRLCLEVLIDYDIESDESLGVDRALAKTPLSYRLAFNTLYDAGILKEKE